MVKRGFQSGNQLPKSSSFRFVTAMSTITILGGVVEGEEKMEMKGGVGGFIAALGSSSFGAFSANVYDSRQTCK